MKSLVRHIMILPMCMLLLAGTAGTSLFVHVCGQRHHSASLSIGHHSDPCTTGSAAHDCCPQHCSHDDEDLPAPAGISQLSCCTAAALTFTLNQYLHSNHHELHILVVPILTISLALFVPTTLTSSMHQEYSMRSIPPSAQRNLPLRL